MSRRSTHTKRAARALAEQTGMTYQQAHNILTSVQEVPVTVPATPAMLAAFAKRMVEAGTVESTWLPVPMRPERLTATRTATATENPLVVLLSDPTGDGETLEFDLDFFDQPDKAERFLIHTDGLGLTTRDPNLKVTAIYRLVPTAPVAEDTDEVRWSNFPDRVPLDVPAHEELVAAIREVVYRSLPNAGTITAIEATYDDTDLVGLHVYRNHEWDGELLPFTEEHEAIEEIMGAYSDDAFEVTHEGNVGAHGAERRQFMVRLPKVVSPFKGVCDYCDADVALAGYAGDPVGYQWTGEDGTFDCPENEGGHKVFDPLNGFEQGPCREYVVDEAAPDGDEFCVRCFHVRDVHPAVEKVSLTMGECPSCEKPRPFPVDQPGGCLFLPGSICPNCGHMEVESEVESEDGRWLVTLDREGIVRWVDENGNTEAVVTPDDDESEWDRYASVLSADRRLVREALTALDND